MLIVPEGTSYWYLAQRSEPKSAEQYAEACQIDFEAMKPYLLEGDLIDIGCGLGGPTSLIAQHCGGTVHLVDGTADGARKAGYKPTMEPYNDRAMTERMLEANGVTDYHWHNVGTKTLPKVQNVVSLISWGWHYPVSTYLEAVESALPKGGRLILDLRPGQGGEAELAHSFELVARYQGFGKCAKSAWARK